MRYWWITIPIVLVLLPRLLGKRAWRAKGLPPIGKTPGGAFSQEFLFPTQAEALAKANQLTSAGWSFVRVDEVPV